MTQANGGRQPTTDSERWARYEAVERMYRVKGGTRFAINLYRQFLDGARKIGRSTQAMAAMDGVNPLDEIAAKLTAAQIKMTNTQVAIDALLEADPELVKWGAMHIYRAQADVDERLHAIVAQASSSPGTAVQIPADLAEHMRAEVAAASYEEIIEIRRREWWPSRC